MNLRRQLRRAVNRYLADHPEVRKRLDEEKRLKWTAALESQFETVAGDQRFCVRRLDVVEHVAQVLNIPVLNNRVFADVARAASSLGWQPVKNGGRSLFRCVKPRGIGLEEALTVSKALRYDPRYPQSTAIPR